MTFLARSTVLPTFTCRALELAPTASSKPPHFSITWNPNSFTFPLPRPRDFKLGSTTLRHVDGDGAATTSPSTIVPTKLLQRQRKREQGPICRSPLALAPGPRNCSLAPTDRQRCLGVQPWAFPSQGCDNLQDYFLQRPPDIPAVILIGSLLPAVRFRPRRTCSPSRLIPRIAPASYLLTESPIAATSLSRLK